eukprot:m.95470 g.95470  ORF g.95470 m.95470 type:complete len:64 (-) comp15154_c1_seq3:52-243(-)
MSAVPTLSNEAQVKVMNLVKEGKSIDEAIQIAREMEAAEVTTQPRRARTPACESCLLLLMELL